jgi:hypothetical protein
MGRICNATGGGLNNMAKDVAIPKLNLNTLVVTVEGDKLLMEKMDPNVAKVYDKKKSKQLYKEDTRSEREKVDDKIHYTADGNVGFPSSGFLNGMLDVAPRINGAKNFPNKIDIKQGIRFLDSIVPINFEKQEILEGIGVSSGQTGAPRLIVRPVFYNWSADLRIQYNTDIFSADQVVNLINWAGFNCGIGGWRPSCSGTFGVYKVKTNGGK